MERLQYQLDGRSYGLLLCIPVLLLTLLFGSLALAGATMPEIIGAPPSLESAYDLTWTLTVTGAELPAMKMLVEHTRAGQGYRFTLTPTEWRWETPGTRSRERTVIPLTLHLGQTYTFTFKRRSGRAALLVDHRLVRTVPAPTLPRGRVQISCLPGWATLDTMRYVPVGPRHFGDDFMRSEVRERFLQHPTPWFEDEIWQVAYYRKAWPGQDPRDPVTGRAMTMPWQLGGLLNTRTTPNSFWYAYTGAGPSWVIANALSVPPSWDRYFVEAAIKPEYGSAVGLIAAYQNHAQYLLFRWEQEAHDAGPRAALYAIIGGQPQLLATARPGFQPRQWYTVRLHLGWTELQVWVDGVELLSTPNPGLIEGRIGLFAEGATQPMIPTIDEATTALYAAGMAEIDPSWTLQSIPCIYFDDVRVGDWEETPGQTAPRSLGQHQAGPHALAAGPSLPEGLLLDPWSQTFTSADALWTPAFTPFDPVTPSGKSLREIGPAAPVRTDQPGLYWHKGRHHHDLTVTVPLAHITSPGPTLHLTGGYAPVGGYRIRVEHERGHGVVRVYRQQAPLGRYRFDPARWTHLVVVRQDASLLLRLVASEEAGAPHTAEQVLLRYRDRRPLLATQVGFTVTDARLPAAHLQVTSDWHQETFATAPTAWRTAHGVWGTMTRYACDPRWNWFGGYGATTPTAWLKPQLIGDQTFEAYLAIKMEYDNRPHEAAARFRDLNVSICTDGLDPESGYTLSRGHRVDGKPVTQLRRRGTVVWSSTAPAHLMPSFRVGYQAWLAMRLVKTGPTVAVYLDHQLAGTFTDPEPLSGGHAAIWTVNNGLVIGRVNYGAATRLPTSMLTPLDHATHLATITPAPDHR